MTDGGNQFDSTDDRTSPKAPTLPSQRRDTAVRGGVRPRAKLAGWPRAAIYAVVGIVALGLSRVLSIGPTSGSFDVAAGILIYAALVVVAGISLLLPSRR